MGTGVSPLGRSVDGASTGWQLTLGEHITIIVSCVISVHQPGVMSGLVLLGKQELVITAP